MQIDIQVVNVDSYKGTTKKGDEYTYYEVTYKNLKDNKVNGKKVFPFGDVPVFEAVKKFAKGDKYTIVQAKEGEYWNWKEVKPLGSAPPVEGAHPSKSAYVPDDVKQRLIVRQSCLASASKIAAAGGMTHENAMEMAQEFVDWVFEVKPKQESRKPKRQEPAEKSLEDAYDDPLDDDIPY